MAWNLFSTKAKSTNSSGSKQQTHFTWCNHFALIVPILTCIWLIFVQWEITFWEWGCVCVCLHEMGVKKAASQQGWLLNVSFVWYDATVMQACCQCVFVFVYQTVNQWEVGSQRWSEHVCKAFLLLNYRGNYSFSVDGGREGNAPPVSTLPPLNVCAHADRWVCSCASDWQGCYLRHQTGCVCVNRECPTPPLPLFAKNINMHEAFLLSIRVYVCAWGGLLITRFLSWICMTASFIIGLA